MQGHDLRALQAPLKATYREDAAAALLTLRAGGELGGEGVSCSVETGRALVEAGLHPYSGGDGSPGLFGGPGSARSASPSSSRRTRATRSSRRC